MNNFGLCEIVFFFFFFCIGYRLCETTLGNYGGFFFGIALSV